MLKRAMHVARGAWCWSLLLLLAGAAILGESRVRIVVISLIEHRVQVELPPPSSAQSVSPTRTPRWTDALLNAPIIEGESIRTQINSEAEVELECGSALRLAPDSRLQFDRLRLRSDGVHVTTVTLKSGEAFFTMQNADSGDFHALLPGAVISMPHGGAMLRLDVPAGGPASVEVLSGRIQVQSGAETTMVHSKRRFFFAPGGIQFAAMAKPDEWQKWSHRRDQAFRRAELNRLPQPPSTYNAAAPGEASQSMNPEAGRGWNLFTPAPLPAPVISSPLSRSPVPAAPYCAHR
ncbi:MAG: FecR domain-containing protein [Terriglobales bacterium]